jgi:hypothetical protein
MFWLSFRQFRAQAVVAAAGLAALTVVVLVAGHQVWDAFHQAATSGGLNNFVMRYTQMSDWLNTLALIVPGLIGVFWGAPLLARELESGTFRLAWTQSVSRTRWTVCKLALLGVAGMAVAGLCSLLVTWWSSPVDFAAGTGPFAHFDVRGIVPIAYAACAFTVGAAAGALVRRTVAAMATALVVFTGLRIAVVEWVRPHLMSPPVLRTAFAITSPRRVQIGTHVPQGAWVVSDSVVNAGGQAVNGGVSGLLVNLSNAVAPNGSISLPGVGSCPNIRPSASQLDNGQSVAGLVARCVNQLHLTNVVTYQPANRYWPFQVYESLIFLAAAVAIGAFTVWWVRRLN